AYSIDREEAERGLLAGFGADLLGLLDALVLERGDLRGLRRFGFAHRALTLEGRPLVDHEARGRDVSEDLPRRADLDPLGGRDVAGHATLDHDRYALDL